MAGSDYTFGIMPDTLQLLGPVAKENLDVIRLIYDFTCWLNDGTEGIGGVSVPVIDVQEAPIAPTWRTDYPLSDTAPPSLPPDIYPLGVQSFAITNAGRSAEFWVDAGSPGLTYVLSFVVTSTLSQRRKQVDTMVAIQYPVNPSMLGASPVITPGQVIVVGGSTVLPVGFDGLIILENGGNQPGIVITMPPTPALGQLVEFIDALGKDQAYPVTFQGDSGAWMDGDGSVTFVSALAFDSLRWRWTGSNWHLMFERFNILA